LVIETIDLRMHGANMRIPQKSQLISFILFSITRQQKNGPL
jgi:hypothetical protein